MRDKVILLAVYLILMRRLENTGDIHQILLLQISDSCLLATALVCVLKIPLRHHVEIQVCEA